MTRIPKPENSKWTDDQWQAITASGKDILVAAAAGSGKTAVLVERMIKKVTSLDAPVDVDKLLVVTFTNAAAQEMRKRIGEALEKELKERPSSIHLRRQLTLINRASISTLHSFCMDILRKYYFKLDLDPSFRIADSTEADLLREEIMEELFEEEYGKENNESFYDLVDRYSNDRSDLDLQALIRDLYDFSRSHPNPNFWLDDMVLSYQKGMETVDELAWVADLKKDIQLQLEGGRAILHRALDITRQPDGPAPYAENILADIEQVEQLIHSSQTSWNALYECFQTFKPSKLKSCKKGEADEQLQKQVKDLREKVNKKIIIKLKDDLFTRKPESYLKDIKEMAPIVKRLTDLVKEFDVRYQEAKRDKGIVDFNDLEHFALTLLTDPNSKQEEVKPSEVARDLQDFFHEVLVDEYQDTNLVQETILKLITNGKNMFMVGDVKQSIYRFRLAEPGLFLSKYRGFSKSEDGDGLRIDLAKNFRSRREVLDGTNYLFKQIMNQVVGEIDYDNDAELKVGASFPDHNEMQAELLLIEKESNDSETEEQEGVEDQVELETAQLEARALSSKIKNLIDSQFKVIDKESGQPRNIMYRDIVILLRSFTWAPTIMEQFKSDGIPVYAELSTGYFEAIEVSVMMSLLKIIDNPLQDIPLASVLRSPIVNLSEEELASIRVHDKKGHFYYALKSYAEASGNEKLQHFLKLFREWREKARQDALSDLIWQIYRDTRYFDFVGGLPGGKQRQANLRALYDRARQYESTSFRGLFRFLRFVERMQDRGNDLGTARALGEQEDVVRMMTIHKSKGLEFPVVFVAGLNKQFNVSDLREKVLLHKELGFGSKFVNPDLRISYPTLPQQAIKRRISLELIAEEMRVLYVALTRAKEKLFLLGTVKSVEKCMESWIGHISNHEWVLPDYERANAKSYLDWIGPALIRHKDVTLLNDLHDLTHLPEEITHNSSKWAIESIQSSLLQAEGETDQEAERSMEKAILSTEKVEIESDLKDQVNKRLSWNYPYEEAEHKRSKQSVTEIKRQKEVPDFHSDTQLINNHQAPIQTRPRFLQEKKISAAEKGTAMHMVMQHIGFNEIATEETIRHLVAQLVNKELLTSGQADAIDIKHIQAFFHTEIGQRLQQAKNIYREVPFSMGLSANEVYSEWTSQEDETVLIQGVMDCIFEDDEGIVLIDYKTDSITERYRNGFVEARPILEERYKVQMDLYGRALERILKKKAHSKFLYFFDGGHVLNM